MKEYSYWKNIGLKTEGYSSFIKKSKIVKTKEDPIKVKDYFYDPMKHRNIGNR